MDDVVDAGKTIESYGRFTRRMLIIAGIAIGSIAITTAVYRAADIVLFAFAGIVVGAGLRGLATWLASHSALSKGWSLAVVAVSIAVVLGLGVLLLGTQIAKQADAMITALPKAVGELREKLSQNPLSKRMLEMSPIENTGQGQNAFSRLTGVFSMTLSALGHTVFVIVLGLYFAAAPGTYRRGVLHLIPKRGRDHAREILDALGTTLQRWLKGQLTSMLIVGVLTTTGLFLLKVKMALALGVIAFLLDFVPNFGPIVAAIPAILLAAAEDPTKALWVVALYIVVQSLEAYCITPFIQKRAVEIPPALLLVAQLMMGILLGIPGLIMATPLVACALVGVKMLYVRDALDDQVPVKALDKH